MAPGSRQGFQPPSVSSQALGRAREGNNNGAESEHSIPLQSFAPLHHRVVAKSSANADEPRRKTTQTEIVDGELEIEQDIDIVLDEVERDDELREVQRDVDRPFDEEAQNDERCEIDRGLLGWYRIGSIVNFGISFFFDSWHAILPSSTYRTPLPDTLVDGEDAFVHQPPIAWERFRTLLFNRLIAFLGLVVWIFNISTALGYVMLMNDPTPPKPSFIIGDIVTWFLTTGMMICHGILTTGTMKDYARRLVILAIFTCFVVAVVFHFAGASNFASSFPAGITMAIMLIQIW
ncbi:uncharacterized protein PAC_17834 [Phialocephala subalpina]|uniref:Uncharacterized protein n=1 Tax=Phialocephala subalpina TaxID=576137 RepID=A0A1L7XSF5_9HELO|nr:uncharacterized protein PAC_17834 [Phialocephala subalpina]